jgi:hypothetical protein
MFTPGSSGQAPLKALSMIPHMSDQQLTAIAKDSTNPISTFAIAALNSRQIDRTKAATAGAQNAPTVANQVLSKEQPGINALPNNMQQQQPQPQGVTQLAQNEEAPQQMAEGGVASLDTGNMYDEKNYAGGGIVAFDDGGKVKGFDGTTGSGVELLEKYKPDWLKNPTAALFPSEPVPTIDDIKMQQLAANQAYDVDPNYFKTRATETAAANKEELDSSRRLSNANILFAAAEKLGTTPGSLLKGIVAAGPAAGKAAIEGGQNEIKMKQLQRLADEKLKDAQYAQNRGDAQAAQKSIEDYKKLRAEMGLKAAELETKIKEVGITADAAKAGKLSGLQNTARDNAMNEMKAAYPTGVNDTHFGGNTNKVDLYNAELEQRYKNNLAILYKNNDVINPEANVKSSNVAATNTPATNAGAPTGRPKPTQDDMKYVLDNLNNPAVAAKYEETFGVKAPRSMADLIPQ